MMDTEQSELVSLEDAFDSALTDNSDEEIVVEEDVSSPETDVEVEEVEDVVDDVEQPDSESIEEKEEPAKLSDLMKEESEPEKVESPTVDWDRLVEVPKHGEVPLSELRDGYLRNDDYTQKTQVLADQRKGNEKAISLWEMLQDDAVGTIAQMAVRAGLITEDSLESLPASQETVKLPADAPQTADIEKLVAEKVKEIIESTPEISSLKQEAASRRVQEELGRLEKVYSAEFDDDDRVAIVKTAVANREGLELTFLKMKEQVDRLNAEKDRVVRSATRQRSVKAPSKEVLDKPATIEEAWERAVASLS